MSNTTSIVLNAVEIEDLNSFMIEHFSSCQKENKGPVRFSINSTPTGIADNIKVTCNTCGESKDISDYASW